ncbi:MAG: hypothetical protein IJ223_01025 [Clostridia bacterium]|nr:hypothetical protein [Clostridia bacterium]
MENNDMSEIINKISSMMNNSSSSSKEGNNSSSISPETISQMIQMLQSSSGSENSQNSESSDSTTSSNNIDIETILKFKTMFDKINSKDDERSRLLLALKPYLKDSRKNKVDKYIQFLNLSKVIDVFGNSAIGGDKN